MRIGILGLTANPPHLGHREMAQVASKDFDAIWVIPCHKHRFKVGLPNNRHRLKMCLVTFAGLPKVYVSSYEML